MQFDEGREMHTAAERCRPESPDTSRKKLHVMRTTGTFAEDGDILYTITCVQEG